MFSQSVFILGNQTNWPPMTPLGQFFYILLMVAIVGVLAYFSTKMLATARRGGGGLNSKRNLQIIDSIGVSTQSTVQIIRAGERFFLIGVSRDRVNFLTEIKKDEIEIIASQNPAFNKIFKKFFNKENNGANDDNQS